MTIADIKKNINSTHLSDLIPIKELNGEVKDNYQLSYCTYEQIINEYPFLKDEPLYASPNGSNPCFYYDGKCLFSIPLYTTEKEIGGNIKPMPMFMCMKSPKEDYFEKVSYMKEKYKIEMCNLYIGDDTLSIDFFLSQIDNIPKNKLFETVMHLYTSMDYGFGILNEDVLNKISSSRTKEQTEIMENSLKNEPYILTIYRGEGDSSTQDGFSYSLDINVANFFATRLSSKARIIKAKIKKEDVIWYENDRGEKEVIINPKDILEREVIELYSAKSESFFDGFSSDRYQIFRAMLNEFPLSKRGSDHNKLHMLRVLFLGLLMCDRECDGTIFTNYDLNTLCLALTFHDIGRVNDIDDEKHGIDSYNLLSNHLASMGFTKEDYNDEFLRFLMKYHCIDDEIAIKEIKRMNIPISQRAKLLTCFKIVKDADALDRVRFGIRELDVNYLRLENSIKYTLIAQQTFNSLKL